MFFITNVTVFNPNVHRVIANVYVNNVTGDCFLGVIREFRDHENGIVAAKIKILIFVNVQSK